MWFKQSSKSDEEPIGYLALWYPVWLDRDRDETQEPIGYEISTERPEFAGGCSGSMGEQGERLSLDDAVARICGRM